MAEAMSQFALKVSGGNSYPARELRGCYRSKAQRARGKMDEDMLVSGDGLIAWGPAHRSRSDSEPGGPSAGGGLLWFPRSEMVELVLDRLRGSWETDGGARHFASRHLSPRRDSSFPQRPLDDCAPSEQISRVDSKGRLVSMNGDEAEDVRVRGYLERFCSSRLSRYSVCLYSFGRLTLPSCPKLPAPC